MEFNDSQSSIEKTMSQEALSMMEQSVKLRDGHQYEVALPWKVFSPDLSNNKMQAKQRLQLLKKRLTTDCDLHQKYSVFMNDLLERGYAREVPDDQIGKPGGYLPLHPVIHPQKANKVRVVFDCAAMFQGTSLNKQILQGPDFRKEKAVRRNFYVDDCLKSVGSEQDVISFVTCLPKGGYA